MTRDAHDLLPAENDGSRPSRLTLARALTGELKGEAARSALEWIDHTEDGRSWRDEVEACRDQVAPFDAAALRQRADQPSGSTWEAPQPANNLRGFLLLAVAAAMAVVAVIAFPALAPLEAPPEGPDILFRGTADLQVYQQAGDDWAPYDGEPVEAGQALGLRVDPADHQGVVVLSVDGEDTISQYYPMSGEAPLEVAGTDGRLPETIVLDDAPGPEVVIALFDLSVSEARTLVEDAWARGGLDELEALASSRGDVDVTVVRRR